MYENPLFAQRVRRFGEKGWEAGDKMDRKPSKRKSAPSAPFGDEDDFNIINFTEDEEKQFDI